MIFTQKRWNVLFITVLLAVFMFAWAAHGAEKQLTFEWSQTDTDLPDLAKWQLYMSLDPDLPFDQWSLQGDIVYDGTPASVYNAPFTITVPDGAETSTWFKITAVDKDGNASDPSELQEGAPTVLDFKAPAVVVDLAAVFDNQAKTVTLTWTTDPADTDIASQEVFKASVAGGPYTSIGEGSSPFVYQIIAGDPNPVYFAVVAKDNDGNFSLNSNEVSVLRVIGVPFGLKVTVESQ